MKRRNTTKRPPVSVLALIERLEPRAMLAGVGPDSWSAAAPATAVLGTGTLSSSGILLSCSSPTPGSSGTSSIPAPTTGSGGAPSGGVLWLASASGSVAGSSGSGTNGTVNTNGLALSSQSSGSTRVSGQGTSLDGSSSAKNGGDLWFYYGAGSGAGASKPGSTGSGGPLQLIYDASQSKNGGTRSQPGTTGSTALALADGESSATTTPLVYQHGSDDGPGFVSGVWTGDDGGWQIVRVADVATAGESVSDSRGWIGAIGDVAGGVGSYVGRSTKSLVFGDWTDEAPTALSIGAGFGLGIVGADLPLDIRDLGHTVSHPEMSYDWGKRLVINGVAVLPVIGVIKYLKYFEDAGDLAKRADDISEGKRLAGQWDAGNYPTPPGRSAEWTWAPGSSEGRTGWRWWDPQGGEWRWHPSDSWHPNGHWDYNPWQTWNDRWRNVDVPSGGNPAASP